MTDPEKTIVPTGDTPEATPEVTATETPIETSEMPAAPEAPLATEADYTHTSSSGPAPEEEVVPATEEPLVPAPTVVPDPTFVPAPTFLIPEGTPMPSIGRIVHYVIPKGRRSEGQPRAAIVTNTWGGHGVNLHVFFDHGNDDHTFGEIPWATSVPYDANSTPGTWHWPPRV